jgi:MFS family permease
MRGALNGIFFLSGAAALVFENLWFRQAGLAFGNSVWASSLVLASFMAGLALGNATAARRGSGFLRPVRAYAALEVAVGVSGALVAIFLPAAGLGLVPLLRGLAETPAAVNALRLGASFLLLVVPTTAMGLTLPILTRALARAQVPFGEALGALYGWNTVGAVTGALGVEVVLVPVLGVRGSAIFAALLSTVAALLALRVSRRFEGFASEEASARPPRTPAGGEGLRLLVAAFLAGAILLALEVVWFRFLLMFCAGSSLAFALLLAVVLLGIGLGGLLAAVWLRRGTGAHHWLGALLCGAGLLVVSQYAGFNGILPRLGGLYFLEPDAHVPGRPRQAPFRAGFGTIYEHKADWASAASLAELRRLVG